MTALESKIYKVIAASHGIKGAEIANKLQMDKKEVNSTLSKSSALKALVKQENDYKWYLIAHNSVGVSNGYVPKPDEELHRLCNYYLQCISLEASGSVSHFLKSHFWVSILQCSLCQWCRLLSLGERFLLLMLLLTREQDLICFLDISSLRSAT